MDYRNSRADPTRGWGVVGREVMDGAGKSRVGESLIEEGRKNI